MVSIPSPTPFRRHAAPHPSLPWFAPSAAVLLLGALFLLLTVDALVEPRAGFDLPLMRRIQAVDLPEVPTVVAVVEHLTASAGAKLMWASAVVLLLALRWWAAAITTALIPLGGAVNLLVGEVLVGRTRPHLAELARTSSNPAERSFPSGHVLGAVMLYGLLFVVAGQVPFRPLRLAIRAATVAVVATVGVGRVWAGAHWPTDVLAAYALGGLLLMALVAVYRRLDDALSGLPLVHAVGLPHDEARAHAHALTSLVLFDEERVAKVYAPGLVPRLVYWAAFQAPFPYERNRAALIAAQGRRNLAAMLTAYWYGAPRVARILGIEHAPTGDGRFAVVSERVRGNAPVDTADARRFLEGLRARFEEAGLPTWQIDPRQPRAVDNLLETAPGVYAIVDLESGLVSAIVSPRTLRRAVRRAMVPIFDDVYGDVTRAYVDREAGAMTAAMGAAWVAELRATVDAEEAAAARWRAGEPRVWHRLLTGFGLPARVASLRARTAGSQERVQAWLAAAVDGWEGEGRISGAEAATLRRQMEEPSFQAMVPYLGAHLVVSVPLRFPVGSIVRPLMVAGALGVAATRRARGRIDRDAWRVARSIHSPLVMVLAATPGVGSFAYLAAKPVRSHRLLMRVMADAALAKAPKRLYERTGLRGRVARPAGSVPAAVAPVAVAPVAAMSAVVLVAAAPPAPAVIETEAATLTTTATPPATAA